MKHTHGTRNAIIASEEEVLLAEVGRALESSGNSQTIGRNGEIPFIGFLNRMLPNTLVAKSGHFLSPSGARSPQIDVMILDARYPLLSENADESVLAMLHSVISCVELKTNVKTADLKNLWKNSKTVRNLSSELFPEFGSFDNVSFSAFCYRSATRLNTLSNRYAEQFSDVAGYSDLTLLRVPKKDIPPTGALGVQLHYEPVLDDSSEEYKEIEEYLVNGYLMTEVPKYSPLSDFYYRLVQDSYYCLSERNYNFNDIGRHFMDYMSWSTAKYE